MKVFLISACSTQPGFNYSTEKLAGGAGGGQLPADCQQLIGGSWFKLTQLRRYSVPGVEKLRRVCFHHWGVLQRWGPPPPAHPPPGPAGGSRWSGSNVRLLLDQPVNGWWWVVVGGGGSGSLTGSRITAKLRRVQVGSELETSFGSWFPARRNVGLETSNTPELSERRSTETRVGEAGPVLGHHWDAAGAELGGRPAPSRGPM